MSKSIVRPDYITYVEVCGVEFNDAHVWVDSSPAEPDVNWPGSFEITGVERNGEDIMGLMTDAEIESMTQRLYEQECEAASDDGYGDYMYDLRKDEG